MTQSKGIRQHPSRQYGMDHDRYKWSMLADRPKVAWPDGKMLALWVNVSLQCYPLNPALKPVAVSGNMTMPYPDLRHFSLRDYGNRVGVFRILRACDRYGIQPTFAINGQMAQRYPRLLTEIVDRRAEVIAHSWNMDTPHATGLDEAVEKDVIRRTIDALRNHGAHVRGWLSPGRFESWKTPDFIRAEGIEYFCDWVNDDMPYRFHTSAGELWAMPLSAELEDKTVIMDNLHSEVSWGQQVIDAADMLIEEARRQGGRILSLSLHPWLMGQPHRIKHLEHVLENLTGRQEVYSATASSLIKDFVANPMMARNQHG
ncbi:polysaccharide deacetylase family protein [Paracandidimonas lactea]|uniref:polysaccharide deacetylase family protein n=1 Tax=Paracandidimonas lactea TaxID=2895524 RepID=UPI001F2E8669|nr:polysaccharide deacetylase family protein [Paracandidimonas lactea]